MKIGPILPKGLLWRVTVLMSLALLPLGLISVYQTKTVVDDAQALSRSALLSATREAAARERELIQEARGAAKALAAIMVGLDDARCGDVMKSFVGNQERYVFAGFIRSTGLMACQSSGDPIDFSNSDDFISAMQSPVPNISVTKSGAITGRPVILIMQPAFADGEVIGFVSLSIPVRTADKMLTSIGPRDGLKLAILSPEGEVIAASDGADEAASFLPAATLPSDLVTRTLQSFSETSGSGEARYFAVAPMIEEHLVLVGSWPARQVFDGSARISAALAVLFPVLMWVAGILVAVLGLQRLVIRHVKRLQSAMRRFALGDRRMEELVLDNPPEEFSDAQRAFNRMAFLISQADARQERDLRDKEVLLREVHHRVKNNLQLIASIMNMQSRNAKTEETKFMLSGLQRRVRGLAMLHRTLYAKPELTTVNSKDLIETVIQDVTMISSNSGLAVDKQIASFDLYPDQAVPLSMFVAEALTNAFKYAAQEHDDAAIRVVLEERENSDVQLVISNVMSDRVTVREFDGDVGDGLGGRLMLAFATQLDGYTEHEENDGIYYIRLSFRPREFSLDGPFNGGN